MDTPIFFPKKAEYRISTENVTLTLLVTEEGSLKGDNAPNPELQTRLHTHSAYELFACTRGAIHLQTQHGTIALCAGDVAVVPPGLLHYQLFDTPDAQWCVFDFICTERRKASKTNLMRDLSPLLDTQHFSVAHAAHEQARAFAEIASFEDDTPYLSALRFIAALAALARQPLHIVNDESTKNTATLALFPDKDIDRLSRLDILINAHFMNDLTLSRAAELLFISERQLQRITQKEYGMSFASLLCKRRLDTAQALLSDSTLSIEKIATLSGFPSRAALTRAFSKKFGQTPAEYQKNSIRNGVK